jgi:glutamate racemase
LRLPGGGGINGVDKTRRPIGVFDSGIGGLTVLKELTRLLPGEDTVYLGDTARVPYGSKSRETVVRYALEDAAFLLRHGVKLIVVACNTASAFALDALKKGVDIPVVGVIEPGARAAVSATRTGRVGVIGTEGTIRSNVYSSALEGMDKKVAAYARACPLFVPLVEEGWIDDPVTTLVAERYLVEMKAAGIDTIVLGCTHYPLIKGAISRVLGPGVSVIDSGEAAAGEVKRVLTAMGLLNRRASGGAHGFFVTDSPERFVSVGKRFFGAGLDTAGLVALE